MARKVKGIVGILFLIIIIGVIIIGPNALAITNVDEYSLTKTFGKIERAIDSAGPSFKTPLLENVD